MRGRPVAALFGLPGGEGADEAGSAGAPDDLRTAAALMSEAQRVANFGSWEWRVADDRVVWSDQMFRIFGLDSGGFDATLNGYLDQVHPEDREHVAREIDAGIRERRPYRFEHRIIRAGGEERVLRCQGEPIVDPASGEVARVVGVCQDVTELILSERARDQADARFRSAFENAPIGIALVDFSSGADGRLTEVNRALGELTGRAEDDLVGSSISTLSLSEDADVDLALRERLVAGEIDRFSIEKRALFDDRLVWLQLSVSALPEGGGQQGRQGIVQVQDVTERKRFEDQLRYMADHDSLTGLTNRRRFREELESRLALQRRYGGEGALLVLDVDGLKAINDSRGHGAGDLVLRRVAEVMRARMRSTDVVARLAGDEFAVLLPNAGAGEATALGEELISRLRDEQVEGLAISVSVGVAAFGDEPRAAEDVAAAADAAMYRAKQRGGAVAEAARPPVGMAARTATAGPSQSAVMPPSEPARRAAADSLTARVRNALHADELVLYAQPVIDLRSGGVAHREVLIRMRDDSGVVRPAFEFLAAAAQEPGLCAEIDRWVAERTLALLGNGARGTRLQMNLSGETLSDARLLARFVETVAGTPEEAAWLGLEIGEAAIKHNTVSASAAMRQLSETGCPLVLDGLTGRAGSFEYLQRLPLDQVKIDGLVTSRLLGQDADHATLRAIVRIAQGTGKTTVAKLVESEAMVSILRMHEVDMAQGYELGEPAPLGD